MLFCIACEVMCCTACCMQDWQENSLCPSPAAVDISKDIPATCLLLNDHQFLYAPAWLHFNFCGDCMFWIVHIISFLWFEIHIHSPATLLDTTACQCQYLSKWHHSNTVETWLSIVSEKLGELMLQTAFDPCNCFLLFSWPEQHLVRYLATIAHLIGRANQRNVYIPKGCNVWLFNLMFPSVCSNQSSHYLNSHWI